MAIFVANLLPVTHVSGVNGTGSINEDGLPLIEPKETFSGSPADYADYVAFWSLQLHFAGRQLRPWGEFKELVDAVLGMLAQHARRLNAHSAQLPATGPHWTSGKLFALQLGDAEVHRQVLVQMLIHVTRFAEGGAEVRAALEARLIEALGATPPHGRAFAAAVKAEMDREAVWLAWKTRKGEKKTCARLVRSRVYALTTAAVQQL